MNRIKSISETPTTLPGPSNGVGFQCCHESLLRSFQILELVKDWAKEGASGKILLEIIDFLQSAPNAEFKL